jgi:hypothetical protein
VSPFGLGFGFGDLSGVSGFGFGGLSGVSGFGFGVGVGFGFGVGSGFGCGGVSGRGTGVGMSVEIDVGKDNTFASVAETLATLTISATLFCGIPILFAKSLGFESALYPLFGITRPLLMLVDWEIGISISWLLLLSSGDTLLF